MIVCCTTSRLNEENEFLRVLILNAVQWPGQGSNVFFSTILYLFIKSKPILFERQSLQDPVRGIPWKMLYKSPI